MDWKEYLTVLQQGGPGLASLVDEAQGGATSAALTTTRLVHDTDELARLSRQLYDRCEGRATTLFAGLRHAERLGGELRDRFERLAASGVAIVLFGVGVPSTLPSGAVWVRVPPRSSALENQWFLVAEAPEPIALLSFVIPAHPAPKGGPGDAARTFAAFVSRDGRLVDAIVRTLRAVADRGGVAL